MNDFNENEIDKAFRSTIDGKGLPVPPSIWTNVRSDALQRQLIKTQTLNSWLKGVSGLLAACLAGALYLLGQQSVSITSTQEKATAQQVKHDTLYVLSPQIQVATTAPAQQKINIAASLPQSLNKPVPVTQTIQETGLSVPPTRSENKTQETVATQPTEEASEASITAEGDRMPDTHVAPIKNLFSEELTTGDISDFPKPVIDHESGLIINLQGESVSQPDGSEQTVQPNLTPFVPAEQRLPAPFRTNTDGSLPVIHHKNGSDQQPATLPASYPLGWPQFKLFDYLMPIWPSLFSTDSGQPTYLPGKK